VIQCEFLKIDINENKQEIFIFMKRRIIFESKIIEWCKKLEHELALNVKNMC
jgi:hypothetical protein